MMTVLVGIFTQLTLTNWLIVGILAIIIILQLTWLFPILNQQVNAILAGEEPQGSCIHNIYGIFEIGKFLILIDFSIRLMF